MLNCFLWVQLQLFNSRVSGIMHLAPFLLIMLIHHVRIFLRVIWAWAFQMVFWCLKVFEGPYHSSSYMKLAGLPACHQHVHPPSHSYSTISQMVFFNFFTYAHQVTWHQNIQGLLPWTLYLHLYSNPCVLTSSRLNVVDGTAIRACSASRTRTFWPSTITLDRRGVFPSMDAWWHITLYNSSTASKPASVKYGLSVVLGCLAST